ncbi:zinc finger SWIM domain-containing protein 1 [Tiliqua scincoides]|uniref:zinc finger SWIM domain-containing protein 1 n=1 Tax=Tiliqua scincoides TaxID=71010 RepID=UPI0034633B75
MAADAVRELLGLPRGSLVAYEADAAGRLAWASLQTPRMREAFLRRPEALLVLRTGARGRALYAFVADPAPPGAELAALVHLAVPAAESPEGLARALRAFQAFNPEWRRVRAFLLAPRSRLPPALAEAFPAARVRLSAFHVCEQLRRDVRRAGLQGQAEGLLLSALRTASCAPSPRNLRALHAALGAFPAPGPLPAPHRAWLLREEVWAPLRPRAWAECGQYFRGLEALARTLAQAFCAGPFLESRLASVARSYQRGLSRPAEAVPPADPPRGSPRGPAATRAQRPLLPRDAPAASPQALLEPRPEAPEPKQEAGPDPATCEQEAAVAAREAAERLERSLRDICTQPAARLCLEEFAAAQSSVQLMGTEEGTVHLQILEDAQTVSRKADSCTCHFNQAFQLPCRHVLAVLKAEGKQLDPERIPAQWRKGHSASQPWQDGTNGLLEVLRSSWDESLDKYLAVSFLTEQISRLLSQCSREEFDRRYCTLRELADGWIGPYVQVKL